MLASAPMSAVEGNSPKPPPPPTPRRPLAPAWLRHLLFALALAALLLAAAGWCAGGLGKVRILGLEVSARDPLKSTLLFAGLAGLRFLAGLAAPELGLVGFGIALSAGLGEVGLRLLDHPWARAGRLRGLHRPSPTLGWELIPGARGYDATGYHVAINAAGFRDREWAPAKPPGVRRVAVLGDSFMFGMGVEVEATLPRQLEARLGPGHEVMNFGVVGYNVYQCEVTLRDKALGFAPDQVVYAAFFNDTMPPFTPDEARAQMSNPLTQSEPADPRESSLYLANFLKNAHGVLWSARHRHLDQATWLRSVADRQAALTGTAWKDHLTSPAPCPPYEASLTRLRDLCRSAGIPFSVLLIPDISQLGDPAWQGFNRWLARLCQDLAIPFTDATPALEAAGDPTTLYLLPHDAHLSPRGHAIASGVLGSKLLGRVP